MASFKDRLTSSQEFLGLSLGKGYSFQKIKILKGCKHQSHFTNHKCDFSGAVFKKWEGQKRKHVFCHPPTFLQTTAGVILVGKGLPILQCPVEKGRGQSLLGF
ncbi:hypothetical protein CEXT_711631 [Caerostris extrusa]|uniref:Uncharacterized protein n=1 Tax=Caerostris extrusa TaxID=172846 RepID=A0AAV4WCB3_CAEEX|nr:hypothetical protein CEXT_711631 [Caerostris extrusa]